MFEVETLITHVKESILNAFNNLSKLNNQILNMDGMSGHKTRHLYNNMCSLDGCNYLEIGTWKGSSFISAMYGNTSTNGTVIDNWSEFGGPKSEFIANVSNTISDAKIQVIDKDCWSVTHEDIKQPIDIYMYDGGHTFEEQKNAITYYTQFCSKYFILIIDDWVSNNEARPGTLKGIEESKLKVHYKHEIGLVNTSSCHTGGDTFWNGSGIFVCERTDI